jgi:hypothetical protein
MELYEGFMTSCSCSPAYELQPIARYMTRISISRLLNLCALLLKLADLKS